MISSGSSLSDGHRESFSPRAVFGGERQTQSLGVLDRAFIATLSEGLGKDLGQIQKDVRIGTGEGDWDDRQGSPDRPGEDFARGPLGGVGDEGVIIARRKRVVHRHSTAPDEQVQLDPMNGLGDHVRPLDEVVGEARFLLVRRRKQLDRRDERPIGLASDLDPGLPEFFNVGMA